MKEAKNDQGNIVSEQNTAVENSSAVTEINAKDPATVNDTKATADQNEANKQAIAENLPTASKILGPNMNFSTAEAFKLLRANVSFSIPDAAGCKVIGVTSSIPGEGKTFTSVNLSYSFAQTDKKVLLIEADMRLPTISKITGLQPSPGLSNILAGMEQKVAPIQKYTNRLSILVSGDIPPNPSELLASKKMAALIEMLKDKYDYIIIDLPPVTAVSDALVVSKYADGMILVVRQDYGYKTALADTIRQMRQIETKILGIVFNASSGSSGRYGHKYYKRKYGGRYNKYYHNYRHSYETYEHSYENSYEKAGKRAAAAEANAKDTTAKDKKDKKKNNKK